MSEKLCALRKIGGGTGKLTFILTGNSGNGSGYNVGVGLVNFDSSHPFSTITLTAKGGTWGASDITINGAVQEGIALNSPYDIKGKSFRVAIYNGGSGQYSYGQGTFVLE